MTSAPEATPDAKTFATLQARCALAGVVLVRTEGDDGAPEFVVSRWALTRAFRSLVEVEQWLQRVTGRAA